MMKGYIAVIGEGPYRHRFGGCTWRAEGGAVSGEAPALVITLDLGDERLSVLRKSGLAELPLVTHVNTDAWLERQLFQVDEAAMAVRALQVAPQATTLEGEDRFQLPFTERALSLRFPRAEEDPDVVGKVQASDSLLGGAGVIRILGKPVWLQEAIAPEPCDCGSELAYVASLGYEVKSGGLTGARPFFMGECAFYFFFCGPCRLVAVHSQAS